MYRLVVIDSGSSTAISAVASLPEGGALERVAWAALEREQTAFNDADLVLALVDGTPADAPGSLARLGSMRCPAPILVAFASEPDEELLKVAVQVADDVVFPPLRVAELRHRSARLRAQPSREFEAARARLRAEIGLTNLVGHAPAFLRAIELVPRFARADVSVLVTGETGTGKEVCARALHHLSRRRDAPFVVVDCGALPESLFENEIFGHHRGAFTGADREHKGQIAAAEGGTLLLDEIDSLSLACQAKLLRFLQERTYRALGSDRVQNADVKVIAASNRDLGACVKSRQFRSDLYFRLNVLRIELPPLRERRSDIELLAYCFLKECAAWMEAPPATFSAAALRLLSQYEWPGNVRELANVVQRAAVTCDGKCILPRHLELAGAASARAEESVPFGEFRVARAAAVAEFERRYVEELLRKHHGNVTRAAREARQDRRAFGRFVKKYQIDREAL